MKILIKPIVAVLLFCIMQVLSGLVLVAFGMENQEAMLANPTWLALSIIVSGLLTVLILYFMHMFHLKNIDPRLINFSYAHLGVIGVLIGIFAIDLISEILNLPDLMQMEFLGLANNPLGILAIAVVGPIVEELVFRAGVLGYLVRNEMNSWTAIIISAILFGIIHFNPAQIPAAILIGILLGILYVKSHSIVLTSIVHIINNGLAVFEMRKFGDTIADFRLTEVMGNGLTLLFIVVSLLLCYVFMSEYIRKYHRPKGIRHRRHHHHHHHRHQL